MFLFRKHKTYPFSPILKDYKGRSIFSNLTSDNLKWVKNKWWL